MASWVLEGLRVHGSYNTPGWPAADLIDSFRGTPKEFNHDNVVVDDSFPQQH